MKKRYITPDVEIVRIVPHQMLALSPGDQQDPGIGGHEDFFDFSDEGDNN